MQTHVKVVAILFLVFGALLLCLAVAAPVVMGLLGAVVGTSGDPDAKTGAAVMGLVGLFATVFLVVLAIPSLVAGWGLLTLRPWARIVGIIVAVFSLLKIPIGTIFGIYALWVLFNKDTVALLEPASVPAPAPKV